MSGFPNVCWDNESASINLFPKDEKAMLYLVDNIDKGLSVALSQATNCFDRALTREDRLNKRGGLIAGDFTADQAL